MINVCYRQDLNMRKGKLAAQVSHAVMALIQNYLCDYENDKLIIKKKNYDWLIDNYYFLDDMRLDYVKNLNLEKVPNENDCIAFSHQKSAHVDIVDAGLTEFNGPTLTTSGFIDINSEYKERTLQYDHFDYKQLLVVNSDFKQTKEELAPYAAYAFLLALFKSAEIYSDCIVLDLSVDKMLKEYILGRFKKIVVKGDSNMLNELKTTLQNDLYSSEIFIEIQNDKHHSICFSPNNNEFFKKYTQHFKLL